MKLKLPYKSTKKSPVNIKLIGSLLCVFILGGVVLSILIVKTRAALDLTERHGQLHHIITEIKYESVRFNLLLERLISGDNTLNQEKTWAHLDLAKTYTRATLFGGDTQKGPVHRTDLPKLREHLKMTFVLLDQLSQLSTTRLTKSALGLTNLPTGVTFDDIYNKLLAHLGSAEQMLKKTITVEKNNQTLFALLIGALVLISTIIFTVLFYRYERQRIKTVQQIKDSETRQRAILDNMIEGVITFTQKSIIDTVNPAIESIFQYSPDETVGANLDLLIPESNSQLHHCALTKSSICNNRKTMGPNYTVRGQRKDGSSFPLEISVSEVNMHGECIYTGILRDISERMESENALQQFKHTLDQTLDSVFIVDANTLRFTYVNEGGLQQLGYTRAELFDLHPHDISPNYTETMMVELLEPLINGEKHSIKVETVHQRKNGEHVPVDVFLQYISPDSGPARFVAIAQEIADRNQVNAIFKSLAASASSLNFETFMSDFLERLLEIYDCQHAFIGKLSADRSKITTLAMHLNGTPVENFTFSIDGTPCQDILKTKNTLIGKNAQILYREDPFLVDMNIDSYYGSQLTALDGTIIGIVAVMDIRPLELDQWKEPILDVFSTRMSVELERDIASKELLQHREHLEELVQERTAEMKSARDESNKANQAKSEFLSRMSHELRTPMNAILGFGQILKLDADLLNETQHNNLNEIIDAGQHLLALINEVLDLARIESGKLEVVIEKVVLEKVIHQSIALIQPLATLQKIDIRDLASVKGHVVLADPTRLKQVLVNLLSNAVKYNRIHGKITLSSRVVGKQLRISVNDTGVGLNTRNIKKLFTPFERLDNVINVEGAGIGLVITKHLIELMQGKIGVSSVDGKGSTFWFELELQRPTAKDTISDIQPLVHSERIYEY